tara:strand:+ start:85 stop:567 length:483 start_codon:yes stop_codon:yes gene_type:complete
MIGEIALLIKGLDTAFSLVQKSIERKKEVQQMGAEISGFFRAKEAVETKIAEVKEQDKNAYIGSALEEAIQIQNQEDRLADMMKEIGREYSRQGKSGTWQRVQKQAIQIQKDRDFRYTMHMKKKKVQVQKDDDFYLAIKLLAGIIVLIIGLASLLFVLIT